MWQIHPLFLEMGKKFQKGRDSTLWALAFMNMISYKGGEWYNMKLSDLKNDMVINPAMSSFAHDYLEKWMPTIKKTFTTYSDTLWGGHINTIKETAEMYDRSGVDGKILLVLNTSDNGVIYDTNNDFSFPIQGFIFVPPAQSINRKNVLEVLL